MNIEALHKQGLKKGVPNFGPGDSVKVHVKIVEGNNERTQVFDGVVIARKKGGIGETFTVRKVSFGVGVERIFPVNSPRVEKIEVTKRGKARRAKLYYLRDLQGKAARLEERTSPDKAAAKSVKPKAEEKKVEEKAPAVESSAPIEAKPEVKPAEKKVEVKPTEKKAEPKAEVKAEVKQEAKKEEAK